MSLIEKNETYSPEKILLIRISSIGDILLTTPFIRQVHQKFPMAQIDFVVKEQFKELLQYNPHVTKIIKVNTSSHSSLRNLRQQLKEQKYDFVFDLHNNFRSIFLRSGIATTYGSHISKDKIKQFCLIYLRRNFYKNPKSIPDRYLDTAKTQGVTDDQKGLELYWSEHETEKAHAILKDLKIETTERFVCLAPGAGFFTKRWPAPYVIELIHLIRREKKLKIVILGGTGDSDEISEITNLPDVYDLSGRLSLLESAAVLSKSSALVSNDTGLMHMASAVNVPVVAIFGSSVQEWGFSPFRVRHVLIEETELTCRPCSHIGRNECPRKHFRCMLNIFPDRVFQELVTLIKDTAD